MNNALCTSANSGTKGFISLWNPLSLLAVVAYRLRIPLHSARIHAMLEPHGKHLQPFKGHAVSVGRDGRHEAMQAVIRDEYCHRLWGGCGCHKTGNRARDGPPQPTDLRKKKRAGCRVHPHTRIVKNETRQPGSPKQGSPKQGSPAQGTKPETKPETRHKATKNQRRYAMQFIIMNVEGNPNHVDLEVTMKSLETGDIVTKFFDRQNWEYGPGTVLELTDEGDEPDIYLCDEDYEDVIRQGQTFTTM